MGRVCTCSVPYYTIRIIYVRDMRGTRWRDDFLLRLIVFGLSSSFRRGIGLRSLFATITATRSPVTPLASRITKKHELSHIYTKRRTREGAVVCAPALQCPVYGCCRRRHCYEGAFRDVTFDPKYKCKILLKSPDTGAPPVVPLLCHYTFI